MCLCPFHDNVYINTLRGDTFATWYRSTNSCGLCTQRAITIALRYDSVEFLDKLLTWTDCHEYVMDIFLTAWVHKRICILTFLFSLFGNLFPAYHIHRVFFEYNFETDLEKDFAIHIADNYEAYMEQLHQCALIVEEPFVDFIDHVRMLSVISHHL
jgi:hypothetical protein